MLDHKSAYTWMVEKNSDNMTLIGYDIRIRTN